MSGRPETGSQAGAARSRVAVITAHPRVDFSQHYAFPALLRAGLPFWGALVSGCVVTVALYLLMVWAAPRLGLPI